MPLQRELVEIGTNSLGDPTICCAHCHKPADRNYTVTAPENSLIFQLTCPDGKVTPGTWPNEAQRSAEIAAFLDRTPKR
jgi:hypothetical protein